MRNVWAGFLKHKRQVAVLLIVGGLSWGYYQYVDSLHSHGFDGVNAYGPITKVEYSGNSSWAPGNSDTTEIQEFGGSPLTFCGDVTSDFALGGSYRIKSKTKERTHMEGNLETSTYCENLQHIETFNPNPNLQEMYGAVVDVANPDKYGFAFDVHMATEAEFKSLKNSKVETLNICNETVSFGSIFNSFSPTDLYYSLQVEGNVNTKPFIATQKPTMITIYYNKADRSPRYGCYPLLAIRIESSDHPDNRPVFLSPNVQSYFHEDNQTFTDHLEPHFYGD